MFKHCKLTETRTQRLVGLMFVIGVGLALPGSAAAVGQIGYDGCFANDATPGCVDLPFAPLDGAAAVAVSPDGNSVYVASAISDSIAHFFRGPDGQIAYDGCLANDATQGCHDLPSTPLDSAFAVAVSPDGNSVYVASAISDSIAHFFRGPDGQIAYDGCFANDATQGCHDLPFAPLDGAVGVAVSPDGKSVYVASANSDSIAHFFRSGPDGQIVYDGCLANDATQGCGDLPSAPLNFPAAVAVSPDGKSVYVASAGSDSIAHFFRSGPDGQIVYDGCLANDATQGCGDLPSAPLDGARAVAVSPDGRSVYVASAGSDSIAHFFRSGPQGQIAYDGCLANDATQGCGDLPFAPLDGARAVAVSPDGKSVYVVSAASDSIAHFFRLRAAPAAPTLTSTSPASPANDNHPLVIGSAPAGTSVRLYTDNPACAGPPAATGTAAQLASPGIAINVADNATTQITATATDAGGNPPEPSACSAALAYVESTPAPPSRTCNGLPVTIQGTGNSETLIGTPGNDVIHGQGGNDVIRGRGGNDVLCGGDGRDRLFGGTGRDRLLGDNGHDALNGGTGRDRCDGGAGADTTRRCEVRGRVP